MSSLSRLFQTLLLFLTVLAVTPSQASTAVDITIDRNGVLLKGKFYISEGTGTFPSVILLHGFPGNETDVLGIGRKLSRAGINALTFNYSGSYKSQGIGSFANTQKDIQAAFEFLHQPKNILKYKIDKTRIYLGGYSYGGGMALTYAANHPEITTVFSIAGTDHGEFMREYSRNPQFQKMIDGMFARLAAPTGPVRLAKGATPKEVVEMGIVKLNPTLDLRKSASLLVQKNILLIGGWDDVNVTIDHHVLPLYRALNNEKAKNIRIVAFQDDHVFKNVRDELAQTIIGWLKNASEKKKSETGARK
ncbi:MAG: alpha/beta fold hydrolase [bacterium]|nr:alpha/beta fold hydrolase [bacterium]